MIHILIACLFIFFIVFFMLGGLFVLFIRLGFFDIKDSPDRISWEEFKSWFKWENFKNLIKEKDAQK